MDTKTKNQDKIEEQIDTNSNENEEGIVLESKDSDKLHQYFRSSLIYYINTFSFFFTILFLFIFDFSPVEIIVYTVLSSFLFYSLSIILISFLIKYDNDTFTDTNNDLKIKKWVAFYHLLENHQTNIDIIKFKKINEAEKKEIGLEEILEETDIDSTLNIRIKIQEDMKKKTIH